MVETVCSGVRAGDTRALTTRAYFRSACCPICKTPSTKASHDFVLQEMIDSAHVSPQANKETKAIDNAPIFPSAVLLLGPSRGFDNDIFGPNRTEQDDEWDDDEEMELDPEDITARLSFLPAHEPLRPGGNLIFPCESCMAGNSTGYQCQWPIPMPTEEEIRLESQRTGRVIRIPQADEPKMPLSFADDV